MSRRTVTILGATGSVGSSTLDLLERTPDAFEVLALTAHRDVDKLAAAAIRTGAQLAVVGDEAQGPALRAALDGTGIASDAGRMPSAARPPWARTGRWRRSSAARGSRR
jgi:1-deoxy-D-xylulose-5-phosphate reductoisomerase